MLHPRVYQWIQDSMVCFHQNISFYAAKRLPSTSTVILNIISITQSTLGGRSASCDGSMDQSSDAWLSNCFNDGAVNLSSDDMYAYTHLTLLQKCLLLNLIDSCLIYAPAGMHPASLMIILIFQVSKR